VSKSEILLQHLLQETSEFHFSPSEQFMNNLSENTKLLLFRHGKHTLTQLACDVDSYESLLKKEHQEIW